LKSSFILVLMFTFFLLLVFKASYSLALDLAPDCSSFLKWTPIHFVGDVKAYHGFGNYTDVELEKLGGLNHVPESPPSPGKFISAAPALLVALLDVVLECRSSFLFFLSFSLCFFACLLACLIPHAILFITTSCEEGREAGTVRDNESQGG